MRRIIESALPLILLALMFCCRNYKKTQLEKLFPKKKKILFLENPLERFFYPFVYMILQHTNLISVFMKKSRHVEKISRLDINFSREEAVSRFLIKTGGNMLLLLLSALILTAGTDAFTVSEKKLQAGDCIIRPGRGGKEEDVRLLVKMQEGMREKTEEISIRLKEEKLTFQEYEMEVEKAEKYIDETVLGENPSRDYVDKPLNLAEKIPDSPLSLSWELGINPYITEKGELRDKAITPKTMAGIKAVLSYGDWETEYEMHFLLYPKEKTWEEGARHALDKALKAQDETSSRQAVFILPKNSEGVSFSYSEPEEKMKEKFLVLGLLAAFLIVPLMMENLGKRMEKRELEMLLDYPEIVNKLTLFLGAGHTIPKAWRRIAMEYEKKGKFRYAYEEVKRTLRDMENGASIQDSIEDFGKRIQLIPYMKFSTLIVQNMKKGTKDLLAVLEYEAIEAFRERKETAKRLGEKAGTKLLFPMMLMMGIVFGIILFPAIQGF